MPTTISHYQENLINQAIIKWFCTLTPSYLSHIHYTGIPYKKFEHFVKQDFLDNAGELETVDSIFDLVVDVATAVYGDPQ